MSRLLVVQPYLADYRLAFWDLAMQRFADRGVECRLAVGRPNGVHGQRGDEARRGGLIDLESRSFRLAGPTLRWHSSWRHWGEFDAVVLEASGSLLDTSVGALSSKPIGLWGHIGSFTRRASRIDERIERWQLRNARAVLTYTEQGAAIARSYGVDETRLTVLRNTIDTGELRRKRDAMTPEVAMQTLGIDDWNVSKTFAYIGGLDASKRVGFLADAMDRLWEIDPEIRLVVGGCGSDESLLRRAAARGQVRMVGRVGVAEKAAMAVTTSALLMPGRVGLVAVDSFALGLPIVTTSWPFHAPEFEYLTPGTDSLVTNDSVEAYVEQVNRFTQDAALRNRLRVAAIAKAGWPSLSDMADRFVAGCEPLFSAGWET